jgi:hypothetical protein
MPKFHGYVVKKEYFAVDVDAEDKNQAKDLMWDAELVDEPVDTDWEIVDIEEMQDAHQN